MTRTSVCLPQYKHALVHVVNRNVDLREYLTEEAQVTEKNTTYDLVANVVHDGKPTEGAYRIHVLHHVSCITNSHNLWV